MIRMKEVSFTYEGAQEASLKGINLEIKQGECVILTGVSGSGKTSLARILNGIIPNFYQGELQGRISINKEDLQERPLYEIAGLVGSVFQNPKSQFFTSDVPSELAFIPENLGRDLPLIKRGIRQAVADFSLEDLIDRRVTELSGGEKQRIACAAASTSDPEIYVLDEPSSNLDREGISLLRDSIQGLKEKGKTIVIAEHRLYYLEGLADRVIRLDQGRLVDSFLAEDFFSLSNKQLLEKGFRSTRLEELERGRDLALSSQQELVFSNFHYAYRGHAPCLAIDELRIPQAIVTAIIGENGCGKTSLAKCICGIYKNPGSLLLDGERQSYKRRLSSTFMVMQDVNHQLFTESVWDEVCLSGEEGDEARLEQLLGQLGLGSMRSRHPLSLSGGQKQRLAIATALVSHRQVIIFDEPTSGLDVLHMREVARLIRGLAEKGKTVLVITHDPEFILLSCQYLVEMSKGRVEKTYPLEGNQEEIIRYFSLRGRQ